MGEPHQIALELNGAVPRLESEGRAPHEPEIRFEERRIELIRDSASAQHGFRFDREPLNRQDMRLAEAELRCGLPLAVSEQA
jgi:hypothetical protein